MRVPVGDALALAQPRLETLQVATALPINTTLRRLLRLFIPPSSHFDLNPRRQRVVFGDDKLYTPGEESRSVTVSTHALDFS